MLECIITTILLLTMTWSVKSLRYMFNHLPKISLILIFVLGIINGGTTGKIKGIITDA
ncbi:uncharacterized protein METZ01_LOCUS216599, partial [marine metagenome]